MERASILRYVAPQRQLKTMYRFHDFFELISFLVQAGIQLRTQGLLRRI